MKNKLVYSCFPGTGKTFYCKSHLHCTEVEYWQYKGNNKDGQYIGDVLLACQAFNFVFVSTEPQSLQLLRDADFKIILVYPENGLRSEYLDRYIGRDSPCDFIGAFMKYWHLWIDELKKQVALRHIILGSCEYVDTAIKSLREVANA